MDKFAGIKYSLFSSENFESYLKELGVSILVRKAFIQLRPTFQFFINGENYKMVFGTPLSDVKIDFKLNNEFEYVLPNLQKVYVTVYKESEDTLVELQKHSNNKVSTIVRKFYMDKAIMTYITGTVVASRVYMAIPT